MLFQLNAALFPFCILCFSTIFINTKHMSKTRVHFRTKLFTMLLSSTRESGLTIIRKLLGLLKSHKRFLFYYYGGSSSQTTGQRA